MDRLPPGRSAGDLVVHVRLHLYLFFDFAGYSAFAIGFSYLLGIQTPENFDRPFLARNIRDFWNRWHISLSFWFRDHVYMRFLLAASKGKWFKGKHTASYLGLFLTFGLWACGRARAVLHPLRPLPRGAARAGMTSLPAGTRQRKFWPDGRWWRVLNIVLTFHAFAFGLLIFSGAPFAKAAAEARGDRREGGLPLRCRLGLGS